MALLNKLFSARGGSALGGKKSKLATEPVKAPEKAEIVKKVSEFKFDGILLSPLATEKAVSGQSLNKYIFKVAPKANKIDIIKAVSKTYNVKAVSANIINIPKKARQVGKTLGFKSGYKKAIVTLAKGQTIEIK